MSPIYETRLYYFYHYCVISFFVTGIAKLGVRNPNCEIKMTDLIDVNGGCFCGKITLRAHVLKENIVACHCTDCQKFSGAPFRATLIIDATQLNISGDVCEYSKIAESGNERIQGFCGNCGSQIYATSPDRKIYNIRADV